MEWLGSRVNTGSGFSGGQSHRHTNIDLSLGMYLRETNRKNKDGTHYQLSGNVWDKQKKFPTARVIHNFGRAEHLDKESLKRLAKSILRVCHGVDLGSRTLVQDEPDPNLQIISSAAYGPVALLEELFCNLLEQKGYSTPMGRAMLAMVINRCLAPSS